MLISERSASAASGDDLIIQMIGFPRTADVTPLRFSHARPDRLRFQAAAVQTVLKLIFWSLPGLCYHPDARARGVAFQQGGC